MLSNWKKFTNKTQKNKGGESVRRLPKGKKTSGGATGKGKSSSGSKKVERRPKPSMVETEAKWKAESDMRALSEASEILRSPSRVKAAKKIAQERLEAVKTATEIVLNINSVNNKE